MGLQRGGSASAFSRRLRKDPRSGLVQQLSQRRNDVFFRIKLTPYCGSNQGHVFQQGESHFKHSLRSMRCSTKLGTEPNGI